MTRRQAAGRRRAAAGLVAFALALAPAGAGLAADHRFTPVGSGNPASAGEIRLPPGFESRVIIRPGDPMLHTLSGTFGQYPANPDMNALDPSGRYLFTSHEVFDPHAAARSGSLTRTDLVTGETVVLVSGRRAADGLKWTPWGTLLLGEEYPGGGVWEVNPWTGEHQRRDLLGTFAHEGIAVARDGTVYLGDEDKQGAIYKFVPARPGTADGLTEGKLYALKAGEGWLEIADPANARKEAIEKGATLFNRPEDMEIDAQGRIYVAITGEHRVIVLDDSGPKPRVWDFVKAGVNVPAGDFSWPDNLAFDARGNLYILEDVPGKEMKERDRTDDVWVAEPDQNRDGLADGVHRFAAWAPVGVEPSGAAFSPDGCTLYINSLEAGANHQDGAVLEVTGFCQH